MCFNGPKNAVAFGRKPDSPSPASGPQTLAFSFLIPSGIRQVEERRRVLLQFTLAGRQRRIQRNLINPPAQPFLTNDR